MLQRMALMAATNRDSINVVNPPFSNVSLLLHGNGSNNSTTITDSSPSPKTITVLGNTKISTAQSKFGGSSILFDGSGDSIITNSSTDFDISNGLWTVEFFVYFVTRNNAAIINLIAGDGANIGINIYSLSDGRILVDNGGIGGTGPSGGNLATLTWHHVAVVGTATTTVLYVNGISVATYSDKTGSQYAITRTKIGQLGGGGLGDFNGYLDEVRIVKGVACYTGNFTPPTAAFPDA